MPKKLNIRVECLSYILLKMSFNSGRYLGLMYLKTHFRRKSLKILKPTSSGSLSGTGNVMETTATIETLSSFVADEDENDRKSYFTFSSECACLKFRFRFCGVVEDGKCQCFSLW